MLGLMTLRHKKNFTLEIIYLGTRPSSWHHAGQRADAFGSHIYSQSRGLAAVMEESLSVPVITFMELTVTFG